jgi:alkanesulfonate monooxygenase SsuD/methylene tetrahydromethanopterin reductase-like flavin-dependent oxidoreductase (luciferase family)
MWCKERARTNESAGQRVRSLPYLAGLKEIGQMEIGLGLPTMAPELERGGLSSWARRAEEIGFSSLALNDRLMWGNWSTLPVLAAVATVTDRIGLVTSILLGPLRPPGLLVKDLATIDRLAGPGRLRVGLGVGMRKDDYAAAGVPFDRRGQILDAELAALKEWSLSVGGSGIVGPLPATPGGPPILVGGASDAAIRRAATVDGWNAGGGGPESFAAGAQRVRAAWRAADRAGNPRLMAMVYVSLSGGLEEAEKIFGSYYAFSDERAHAVLEGTATSSDAIRSAVAAYDAAGCDELLLIPCTCQLGEIALIAEAVGTLSGQ